MDLRARLAREQGLTVIVKRHTYSEWNSRIELEVCVRREDGLVMEGVAESFLERCGDYGLVPDDLGRSFQAGTKTLRVIGLRPRAKVPIICEQLVPRPTEPTEVRVAPAAVRHYLHECSGQGKTADRD